MANIQEIIERSFFEAVRKLLVTDGWTPDITDTGTYPNTEAGYKAYRAALLAINTAKAYSIEVFGSGNPQSRGYKDLPRIVFQTSSFLPGDVGYDSSPQEVLDPETNKYELFSYDSKTYDLFIDCRIATKTQAQLRVLMDIIHRAVPLMGYLEYYTDATSNFFVELDSFQPLIQSDDGVLEYNYRYQVPDIQWRDITQITGEITPISQITINTQIADWLGISAYQAGISKIIT